MTNDPVNHPAHYTSHPSGVECIEITRHYCFSIGNAIKYLWRAGLKQDADKSDRDKEVEDLKKAVWYINDRIKQLEGDKEEPQDPRPNTEEEDEEQRLQQLLTKRNSLRERLTKFRDDNHVVYVSDFDREDRERYTEMFRQFEEINDAIEEIYAKKRRKNNH